MESAEAPGPRQNMPEEVQMHIKEAQTQAHEARERATEYRDQAEELGIQAQEARRQACESSRSSRKSERAKVPESEFPERSSPKRRRRHRHHHRHHRGRPKGRAAACEKDADVTDNPVNADPNAAFRESLFDAMADDEGAGFWENVYGQPIHIYSNLKQTNPEGELEQMSDEEYVSYVRARMWEKSHQHILEERARREAEARRRREARDRTARTEAEADNFSQKIEESLRRGQQRNNRKRWKDAWASYSRGWEEMKRNVAQCESQQIAIPWPVKSGRLEDISKEEVETFIRGGTEAPGAQDLVAILKRERVRWHPDKMQQRVGPLDERSQRAITAVFQFLDSMFSTLKS